MPTTLDQPAMWFDNRKLQHLREELTSIAIFDRLYATRTKLTLEDHYAQAMRQMRQSELLAQVERLTASARDRRLVKELTPVRSAQDIADVVQLMKDLVSSVKERDDKTHREGESSAA